LPAGVFLNATASFFRLGEPDLNRKRGFLELALTNLFQGLNLRFGFLCLIAGIRLGPVSKPKLVPHSGQYFIGINSPASLPGQRSLIQWDLVPGLSFPYWEGSYSIDWGIGARYPHLRLGTLIHVMPPHCPE